MEIYEAFEIYEELIIIYACYLFEINIWLYCFDLIIVIFKFLFKLTGKLKCLNKHYHLPQQAFFLALMVWNLISTKTSIKCHHQGETKILI